MSIEEKIRQTLKAYPNFPSEGITFQDISPLLADAELLRETTEEFARRLQEANVEVDSVAGLDARGFLFGVLLAQRLSKPFIMVRKKSKLPSEKVEVDYGLEYGQNCMELQVAAVSQGDKVVIVDDLLATGGSADAGCRLVEKLGGVVSASVFLIELLYCHGEQKLKETRPGMAVISLAKY
jgi:adenine phosphoribosyltransferase